MISVHFGRHVFISTLARVYTCEKTMDNGSMALSGCFMWRTANGPSELTQYMKLDALNEQAVGTPRSCCDSASFGFEFSLQYGDI